MSARQATLGEYVELQRGQSYKSEFIGMPGPILLGLGTIERNGGFRSDSLRTYGGPTPDAIKLSPGDIYVSLKDVTHAADLLGAAARVPEDMPESRLTQDTVRVGIVDEQLTPGYLYWVLRDPAYRSYCRARGTGTTNLDLSRDDFLRYSFRLPSPPEQEEITKMLAALDGKIAVNRRIAVASDAVVRALLEGIDTAHTVKVGELTKNVRDLVAPSDLASDTVYVGLEHIPRRRMWLSVTGAAADVTSSKARFESGDILFGKLRPYFHKVARAAETGVTSTDVLVIRSIEPALAGFALAALSNDEVVQRAVASSEGTRMPRASWKDIAQIPVPWPGETEARSISVRVDSLTRDVEARMRENRTLVALRDVLLPQLMSGNLRVREADQVLAKTV